MCSGCLSLLQLLLVRITPMDTPIHLLAALPP